MQRSDAELVASACGGDVESFRQLYERYYATAVGVARGRLFDRHLAEDAAQEAFAVACRRLHTLRDGARFPVWLATICRRTAARLARTRRSGLRLEHDPVALVEDSTGDDTARVHDALERLDIAAREIVMMHYFSGLSHEEIARVLGISTPAVHGRLQRARRALASALERTQ